MAKAIVFNIQVKDEASGALRELKVKAASMEDAMKKATGAASRLGKSMRKSLDMAMLGALASNAIGSLQGAVQGLTGEYRGLETAMASVNTMAGKDAAGLEDMTDRVKELSKHIPIARDELANGLYQVISNGVPEAQWIAYLEQSSKAAVGGIADLGQTVTVTSTLIKNYGADWADAGKIQDKIQTTAKNGVTSFEQLAASLPRVSGSAAQLGVSMDELMAVFATTTGVTGNTSEVSTQLAAVLNSLIKPTSEATKMAAQMGIGFNAASIKAAGGFQNFMVALDATVKDYAAQSGMLEQEIYGKLFGSAEALRLIGSISGEQKTKFAENVAAMQGSAGAIESAFTDMASTGAAQAQMTANQRASLTDWAAACARAIQPALGFLAALGTTVTTSVQLFGSIGALGKGLFTYAKAALTSAKAVKTYTAAQKLLNISLLGCPLVWIPAALLAVAAAVRIAYVHSDTFRGICDRLWEILKEVGAAVATVAKKIWDLLVKAFEKCADAIKAVWDGVKWLFGIKDSETRATVEQTKKETEELKETADTAALSMDTLLKKMGLLNKAGGNTPKIQANADPGGDIWGLKTIAQYEARLQNLRELQRACNAAQYAELQRQIDLVEKLQDTFTRMGQPIKSALSMIQQINAALGSIEYKNKNQSAPENLTPAVRNMAREYESGFRRTAIMLGVNKKKQEELNKKFAEYRGGWGQLKGAVGSVTSLTDALTGQGSAWDKLVAVIDTALSLYDAVTGIMQVIKTLTDATTAAQAIGIGVKKADTQASLENTTANVAEGASGVIAAHAKIPFVGIAIAGGMIAAMLALMASLPKFAQGGIAYGPTLGLFGEYAGAANNPEVVAPLSRLRSLIGDAAPGMSGKVEFEIRGERLYGVLDRYKTRIARS